MKKLLILIAALALAVTAAGCGQKDSGKTAKTEQGETVEVSDNYAEGASDNVNMKKVDGEELKAQDGENDSAALEDSAVSIEDAKLVQSEGKSIIIVSYKFTNKSDSDESFTSLMKSEAYQDGTELHAAIINEDIEGFDANASAERIERGKTVTVQEAYVLASDTTPITVNVGEFHSESGVKVTKTFELQ